MDGLGNPHHPLHLQHLVRSFSAPLPPPPWSKHSHGRRTAVVRPTVAILLRHSAVLSVSCRYTFCPLLPTAGPHEFNPSMPFSARERLGGPPRQLVCSLCGVGGSDRSLLSPGSCTMGFVHLTIWTRSTIVLCASKPFVKVGSELKVHYFALYHFCD